MIDLIDFATLEDTDDLKHIWSVCFGDPEEYIRLFFNHRFAPEETLVYRDGGRPVSVVYMLPLQIRAKHQLKSSHYIYAAATLPDYRGRGLMRELLERAVVVARQRGEAYSVLVPGEKTLFDYYAKIGYRTVFYMKHLLLSVSEMRKGSVLPRITADAAVMIQAAERCFARHEYIAIWDRGALEYLLRETVAQGGAVLGFVGDNGLGYAVLVPQENRVTVKEIMCDDEDLPDALATVAHYFPAAEYAVRLRSDSSYEKDARASVLRLAKAQNCHAAAIVLDMPEKLCRERNAQRSDRTGPCDFHRTALLLCPQ